MNNVQLKQWRTEQGLTQEEAASLFGVSWRSYSDWERGVYKIPFKAILTIKMIEELTN